MNRESGTFSRLIAAENCGSECLLFCDRVVDFRGMIGRYLLGLWQNGFPLFTSKEPNTLCIIAVAYMNTMVPDRD